jgi:hypothetical protein
MQPSSPTFAYLNNQKSPPTRKYSINARIRIKRAMRRLIGYVKEHRADTNAVPASN